MERNVNFPIACINISRVKCLDGSRIAHKYISLESHSIKHNDMFANWRRSKRIQFQKGKLAASINLSTGARAMKILWMLWINNMTFSSRARRHFPLSPHHLTHFFLKIALICVAIVARRQNNIWKILAKQIIFQFKLHKIFAKDRIELSGEGKKVSQKKPNSKHEFLSPR